MRRLVLATVTVVVGLPMAFLVADDPDATATAWRFDPTRLAGEIPEPMLSAYLDAAETWDIDWALLASIGKIECDHGRTQLPGCWPPGTINHAGARGPMQFLGSTWRASSGRYGLDVSGPPVPDGHGYATDGNGDGIADPWNHYDAVHSAARYLADLGARTDLHTAARRYNAGPDHPDPAAGSAYADRAMQLVGEYRTAAGFGGPGSGLDLLADTPVDAGCSLPDPTGTGGCVTPRTAQLVATLRAAHGQLPIACWAPRPGNPTSDHPRGRACDITVGAIGRFPTPTERNHGWDMADWLIVHADALGITYIIWDGRIWTSDTDWRAYTGGGIYDPLHPTGGHYDHIHISTAGVTRRPTPEQPAGDGWLARAACRDSDARLFTDPQDPDDVRQALATCTTCSVRAACLAAALRHTAEADVGIWGGTTEETRRRIRTGHLTVEEALHTRLPTPPEHQDVKPPPARTTEMQASAPANGRRATDIPRLPEPELTVSRDRNGDYISADGRCVIFRIHGDLPWMLMIDSRCIARTDTLGEARRAAWQARHGTPDLTREHRFDAITRR